MDRCKEGRAKLKKRNVYCHAVFHGLITGYTITIYCLVLCPCLLSLKLPYYVQVDKNLDLAVYS